MQTFRRLLLFCVCLLLFSTAVLAEGNLVRNGDFELTSGDWPDDWFIDQWIKDEDASFFEISQDAYEGQYSVYVENAISNDARFEQILSVEPLTTYRFSAMVKAQDCDPEFKGANLSIADVYDTSPDLHDTDGEWVELEFYGRTGRGQKEVTLMARLGGYGSLNTGKAWFDNVSAVKVDEVPKNAAYLDLSTPAPAVTAPAVEAPPGLEVLVMLAGAALLFGLLIFVLSRRDLATPAIQPALNAKKRRNPALWIGLGLTLALRLIVAVMEKGYEVDMNCFYSWAVQLAEVGPWRFYQTTNFCDYPPAYLYILWGIGSLIRGFGIPAGSAAAQILLKLPAMLCDVAAAGAIYYLARQTWDQRGATALALLYALNPAAILTSAAWGQVDSVMILLLLLTLIYAQKGRWSIALPLYVLAVLTKPQALLFGPIGLVALLQDLVYQWKDKERRVGVLHGLLYSLILLLALPLPFLGDQSPFWLIQKYVSTVGSYDKATLNATNLFYLLGGNWVDHSAPALLGWSWNVWGTLLMAAWFAFVLFLSVRRDARNYLFELCALLILGLFVLGLMMHERYILPVVVLALAAFVHSRDRRWLWVFGIVTATALINIGLVLKFEHLQEPYVSLFFVWVSRILSLLNMAALGVATWAVVDRVLRDRAWPLPERTDQDPPVEFLSRAQRAIQTAPDARLRLRKWDWILMLSITAAYAVVAFWGLGDTAAPQTQWHSEEADVQVTFDLGASHDVRMLYYSGISNDTFTIAYSNDGESWSKEIRAEDGACFRWQELAYPKIDAEGEYVTDNKGNIQYQADPLTMNARYVRLTSLGSQVVLGEVGFRTWDDLKIPVQAVITQYAMEGDQDPKLLADEQNTVPVHPSYMNGTYFDEIYHARTAYEHLHGIPPYETSHPPLGKLIMAVGIWMFGMTPFGWRFMGALMGVLMIPVMYLLGRQLLRRTRWGVLMALLMALDMMHLTQTRIATIDSFGVLFIMLMYLCMYRYVLMSFYHQKLSRTLIPLGLSGLFMGLGIASKWIGLYAAAGLAVMFFYSLYCRYEEYRASAGFEAMEDGPLKTKMGEIRRRFPSALLITLGVAILCFIIIPALIYYASYIPFLAPSGPVTLERIWSVQVNSMFNYHKGLAGDLHPYRSQWYTWPVIGKPMYYYSGTDYAPAGFVSAISAFGNPAVWWVGLLALVMVMGYQLSRLYGRFTGSPSERIERLNRTTLSPAALVLIGFLSNYLPWVLVPRSMFIYHYFASLPFVILCIGLCFQYLSEYYPKPTRVLYVAYVAVCLGMFIAFYPLATGVTVPRTWAEMVSWFPYWMHY